MACSIMQKNIFLVGMRNYSRAKTSCKDLPESHNDIQRMAEFLKNELQWKDKKEKPLTYLDSDAQIVELHSRLGKKIDEKF